MGLPQILILTFSLRNLTSPNFCLQAGILREYMQRIKKTSKHDISIILKLVSIEYQKRGAFLAAV